MEFFRLIKTRREPALLRKFLRDLESGCYAMPRSFDVLSRYRTEELKLNKKGQALGVAFPEHKLMSEFYAKYPEAKLQPITLNSFKAPLAKQFALRQLQLMSMYQMPKHKAFKQVEAEMLPQLQALAGSSTDGQVYLVQQEEQRQLISALEQHVERRGGIQAALQKKYQRS